ncbi:MAG: hypothetical protein JRI68_18900, partial [Deltaproteobacteria bacterium]|nr:hypothetical protein [Deltaproteobacteria bacterium]
MRGATVTKGGRLTRGRPPLWPALRGWLVAGVFVAPLGNGCTTYVDQVPGDSEPPPDHRPLPEAPDPLDPADPQPEVLADGLSSPRGLVQIGDDLYVADHGAGAVLEVALDGTVATVATDLGGPRELATDGTDLFLSDDAGGRVLRLALDGQHSVLASGQLRPVRVRVAASFAYWVDEGENPGSGWVSGAIRRVSTAGGTVEDLAVDLERPRALAVSSLHAFFSDGEVPSRMWRVPLSGRQPEQLVQVDEELAFDAVVDESADALFWVAYAPPWPSTGWVYRSSLDGLQNDRVIHTGPKVLRVAIDGSHVYWSDRDLLA